MKAEPGDGMENGEQTLTCHRTEPLSATPLSPLLPSFLPASPRDRVHHGLLLYTPGGDVTIGVVDISFLVRLEICVGHPRTRRM